MSVVGPPKSHARAPLSVRLAAPQVTWAAYQPPDNTTSYYAKGWRAKRPQATKANSAK